MIIRNSTFIHFWFTVFSHIRPAGIIFCRVFNCRYYQKLLNFTYIRDYNSLCRQNLNQTKLCAMQWLTVYLRKHVSFGEGEREEKLDDYHYLQQWRNNFQTHKRSCHRKANSQFHSSLAKSWVIFELPTNADRSLEMDYMFVLLKP